MEKIHEEVFQFLMQKREKDKSLRFTLRRANHGGKLDQGYWFDGNEDYLAVSFWAGFFWEKKIPEISFVINKDYQCWIEFNFKISSSKSKVAKRIIPQLSLGGINTSNERKSDNQYYYVQYLDYFFSEGKLQEFIRRSLGVFLDKEKKIIDLEISRVLSEEAGDQFELLPKSDFQSMLKKVEFHRKQKEQLEHELTVIDQDQKPSKLKKIRIWDFGRIVDISLHLSSKTSNWVFITGENGSGKTNLLRAIATFLGYRKLSSKELKENKDFRVLADFDDYFDKIERYRNEEVTKKKKPLVEGLAMYGPYRLDVVYSNIQKVNFYKKLEKKNSFESLFKPSGKLLSLDKQFRFWANGNEREKNQFEKRQFFISNLLSEVITDLIEVGFKDSSSGPTEYLFRNSDGTKYKIHWKDLSSGNKSMIAMVGDILIRLYDQQRKVIDPADLRGIVIIDEIDLHLHPKGQKQLVVNLAKSFPKVQFIVSTHSPIPLLGAPKGSVFLTVSQNVDEGITIERIRQLEKDIAKLTPNLLLNSPIFGYAELFSSRFQKDQYINTAADSHETAFDEQLNAAMEQDLSPEKLAELRDLLNQE